MSFQNEKTMPASKHNYEEIRQLRNGCFSRLKTSTFCKIILPTQESKVEKQKSATKNQNEKIDMVKAKK